MFARGRTVCVTALASRVPSWEMIEASTWLVPQKGRLRPVGRLEGWLGPVRRSWATRLLLDLQKKAGCSSVKATLDADARSTYHQHSQRLIHAFIIKLIAAATCWPATHQQANCKAISKVLQSAARYDG